MRDASFKIVIIFNKTSAEIKTKSADELWLWFWKNLGACNCVLKMDGLYKSKCDRAQYNETPQTTLFQFWFD